MYTVTFTLVGFNTTRREGIEVRAAFTAPVNGDLTVGALEETITVTGSSPLVDTTNVTQQTRVTNEMLEALPTSSMGGSVLMAMTPGMVGTASIADVGGTAGYREGMGSNANNATYHGRQGLTYNVDGLSIQRAHPGYFSFVPTPCCSRRRRSRQAARRPAPATAWRSTRSPRRAATRCGSCVRGIFSDG